MQVIMIVLYTVTTTIRCNASYLQHVVWLACLVMVQHGSQLAYSIVLCVFTRY